MIPSSTIADVRALVTDTRAIGAGVSVISLECPGIAATARPGNFVNVKVNASSQPLLRRPFCIHDVRGNTIDIMVKTVGRGTSLLCEATCGTGLLVLGPLGNSFGIETGEFDTALLVSGGIGTAPMLFLEKSLSARGIPFLNLVGGRTRTDLLTRGLSNCSTATDDGSEGFHGNVVELLKHQIASGNAPGRHKVFACGPNPMLKALARFCAASSIPCELSLESVMGCGVGICYGCMVELNNADGEKERILLCREGPVIDGNRFTA
ncbi:MAG: dihydroorotate dehydrogenase electron transfer subunit [Chlorobiaceae bacterium]|nr:dihydroorotate dehydrogenase electron transfer subunit [Chlorobiaceae bacterium]NTW74604.1 dihydroorotate dehydrogenase electron transfer subunit [Chlorobiaceae bacterium]